VDKYKRIEENVHEFCDLMCEIAEVCEEAVARSAFKRGFVYIAVVAINKVCVRIADFINREIEPYDMEIAKVEVQPAPQIPKDVGFHRRQAAIEFREPGSDFPGFYQN